MQTLLENEVYNRSLRFLQRPQKAKSQEPAYLLQVLNEKKTIENGSRCREADCQALVCGVWRYGEEDESGYDLLKSSVFSFEGKSCGKVREGCAKLATAER